MLETGMNVGIYESERREMAAQLTLLLADTYALFLKTQNYHWNVTGKTFSALHGLFERQYQDLFGAIDEIAERIRSLGVPVPASMAEFQKRTSIRENSAYPRATEMILDLIDAHEVLIETSGIVFECAQSLDDFVSSDLAVRRMQFHEKSAWLLRSHLEN
jgi:starvation-inducible DNA-binding protein